jgi:alpha-acetolactate decarboxylase
LIESETGSIIVYGRRLTTPTGKIINYQSSVENKKYPQGESKHKEQNISQTPENTTLNASGNISGNSQRVQNTVHFTQKYPDLQQVIEAWPNLPEHIKAAIKALIQPNTMEKK